MKIIKLTNGKHAYVDDDDYHWLSGFRWNFSPAGRGYAIRHTKKNNKRVAILMHREIMSAKAGEEVDHINGNTLNNCKNNLRIVTHAQNMKNRTAAKNKTSKYLGVYFYRNKNKFCAEIKINGKKKHLGYFIKETEAAKAYNKAATALHGEYANLNVI